MLFNVELNSLISSSLSLSYLDAKDSNKVLEFSILSKNQINKLLHRKKIFNLNKIFYII